MSGNGAPVELVRVLRSGFHEGSHFGAVVVTGPGGEVLHARGNVEAPVFPRSSNKPFQAVAIVQAGADLGDADLALAAASHSGEPMHVERALAMLERIGLSEDDLGCPADLPMNEEARNTVIADHRPSRRIYMNCSGKHAGMLTACVAAGFDTATYLDPAHPLQVSVGSIVSELAGERLRAVGIDGCGAPLFAISLIGLSRAFGRVNAGTAGGIEQRVATAMRNFPEMVGGTGREDTRLMRAFPGLLVKGGAEGVHCAALADGSTVAVKITDGGDRARMPTLVAGLRFLGLSGDLLDELGTGGILGGGVRVGSAELAPGVF